MKLTLKIILASATTLIITFIGLWSYMIFVDEHILDPAEMKSVTAACKQIHIGFKIEEVSKVAGNSNLPLETTKEYWQISDGPCRCRLGYNDNAVIKKYVPGCDVQ